MEVEDSPLNLKNISQTITLQAHQQCRKADRLLARLSMELQRDSHIKQQRLIQERLKRETRREATKSRLAQVQPPPAQVQPPPSSPALLTQTPGQLQPSGPPAAEGVREREYDTLLYQLQTRQTGGCQPLTTPCPGTKTTKDDKTRLEEQQTTIEDLRRLVTRLMDENQQLRSENARLRSEATDADFVECSELWGNSQAGGALGTGGEQVRRSTGGKGKEIAIPQLPPLEMPAQEDLLRFSFFCLPLSERNKKMNVGFVSLRDEAEPTPDVTQNSTRESGERHMYNMCLKCS
ncbi:hypothetical protein F7725_014803 [Dissostichus mawsoni]|uniref:Uncharacterized protein n=1 Tax=Dissostichus mawsoni TaxID=36200 RepID=A0A7J5YX71_DISMA|nr:hypothetical protein F7725_014803 [Dissostichus mawsoni]